MLARKSLLTATDRIIQCKSGESLLVHAIYITNTTGARRTFRLHHLSHNESATTGNALFYDVAIAPNGTLIDSTRLLLNQGDQLAGLADATGVTCTIYGILSS